MDAPTPETRACTNEQPVSMEYLERRLRTDAGFREVCLFWAQFYTELSAADVDVSPLVEAFVEGLFEG